MKERHARRWRSPDEVWRGSNISGTSQHGVGSHLGYARFDNVPLPGASITATAGKLAGSAVRYGSCPQSVGRSHHEVSRLPMSPRARPPDASGPSFCSPRSSGGNAEIRVEYPRWGLKTPRGTFTFTDLPAQETAGLLNVHRGACLRSDSIDGAIVAQGFCEMVQMPALGALLTRQLPTTDLQFDGGLK